WYWKPKAKPLLAAPPSTMSFGPPPPPYMSASAGVEKLESHWNQGKPGSTAPLAALRASCSWPSEPAVTAFTPWRFPTDNEAWTPLVGPPNGSVSVAFHWLAPCGVMAW